MSTCLQTTVEMKTTMKKFMLSILAMWMMISGSRSLAAEKKIEFNRDIRPILSENCYACHGPDSGARKAGLRLDTEEGAKSSRKGSSAVVSGKAMESELYKRIIATDAHELMPPPKSNKKLDENQKALLKRWIDEGAKWEGHWAFLSVKKPAVPKAEDAAFVKNPIDNFILEKQRENSLGHSKEADKITLLRRLCFDLTGLPPTPEQLKNFLADNSAKAYETLVDQLLASPHYGERMAVFWLDLVRYADSVGYHGDQPITVWPFRDWVIQSFNKNIPFTQFTIEQLAGDLLPNATLENKVASGYNRLGMMSAEGGVQDREYLAKYAAERVRNLSGVWLGTTLGCAECHDHKFDPFTTREFYSMEAFFADITEKGLYGGSDFGTRMTLPSKEQQAQLAALDEKIATLKKTLETSTPEIEKQQAAWESSVANSSVKWSVLKPQKAVSKGGAKLAVAEDGSILASGKKADKDTYTLDIKLPKGSFTAIKIEALPHASMPAGGSGRAGNGNFVLSELAATSGDKKPVAFMDASATFEQTFAGDGNPYKKWSAASAIDGNSKGDEWGWAILPEVAKPQHAVFQMKENLAGDSTLVLTLEQNHGKGNHTLGSFRISITDGTRPVKAGGGASLPADVLASLAIEPAKRNEQQKLKLAAHYRTISPVLDAARKDLASIQAKRNDLEKSLPTTLVTVAREPRTIKVLARGNWMDNSGEVVTPAVPAFLPAIKNDGKARLNRQDLAKWLVSDDNPLTSRVLVNRLWKLFYGQGLSKKLEDIGSQGEWPSHPELLDYLASYLRENNWDLKKTIKLMVMSGTYRQTSVPSAELQEKDPYNRWLARQSRFRIDAEFIRDNYLSISGLMVDRQGGPSVKPFQPPGYWSYLNFPTREWQKDNGESVYRRGLYTHWQRQYLHPAMLAFDASCREECSADRVRSNTPLQALALLNDPCEVEAARVFAEKILKEGGKTDAEKIEFAFTRALSRSPKPGEREILLNLVTQYRKSLAQDPGAAKAFLSVGDKPPSGDLSEGELAAWGGVARALFNLHETITRN